MMVYALEKLAGEPIIIDSHRDPLHVDSWHKAFASELAALVDTIDGPAYRICDLSEMSFSYDDLVAVLMSEAQSGRRGSASDPSVHLVLVVDGELASLFAASVQRRGSPDPPFPAFSTREQALAYIRKMIAARGSS